LNSAITFVPVPDGSARDVQLQGGQLDMIQQRNATQIDDLRKIGGQIKLLTQPPGYREIDYYFLISAKAPFNSQDARTAFAEAVNRNEINQIRNKGTFDLANSLMYRSAPGYLKNAGYPAFNLKKAQALVSKVKAANGGQFNITLGTDTEVTVRNATRDEHYVARHRLSGRQVAMLLAGGLLPWLRQQKQMPTT